MVSQTFAALRWTIATTRHSSMNGLAIGEHRPRNWTGLQEISGCRYRCCSSVSRKRKLLRIHYPGDPAKARRSTIVRRSTRADPGTHHRGLLRRSESIIHLVPVRNERLSAFEPSETTGPLDHSQVRGWTTRVRIPKGIWPTDV